ncbi:hypothetical protein TcasGA2_TC033728 [Tribolium castaneum]|uniref:Uncharacterized protein n=1 Tax=Tribolium castaneum TaxID=7070 RepID=A0A139WF57_TRICA|nr:hypothetical protein TcasGA2_TC033728 [Tribolium castaneum]
MFLKVCPQGCDNALISFAAAAEPQQCLVCDRVVRTPCAYF